MNASALVAAVATLTTLATAAPAAADVLDRADRVRDVTAYGNEVAPAPANKQADITRVRVAHGAAKVRSAVRFRDITAVGVHHFVTMLRRPNANGGVVKYAVWLTTSGSDPQGEPRLYRGAIQESVDCPGLTASVDYAADVVRFVVPRSCLGTPTWVRASATGEWVGDHDTYFFDDGLRPGADRDAPKWSRMLFPG